MSYGDGCTHVATARSPKRVAQKIFSQACSGHRAVDHLFVFFSGGMEPVGCAGHAAEHHSIEECAGITAIAVCCGLTAKARYVSAADCSNEVATQQAKMPPDP